MAEYIPKLGKLARETDQRDAIHVAVVPVVAAMDFKGLTHATVALVDGVLMAAPQFRGTNATGVVDPFLTESPKMGERFWLLLKPGTAVGLRHVYYHPHLDAGDLKGWPSVEGGKVTWVKP